MREHSVVRFRHSGRRHAAPRFERANLSRRAPASSREAQAFLSNFGRFAAARKAGGLTEEQTRLWGNIARFVIVVCAYAGIAVGVHLGVVGRF